MILGKRVRPKVQQRQCLASAFHHKTLTNFAACIASIKRGVFDLLEPTIVS